MPVRIAQPLKTEPLRESLVWALVRGAQRAQAVVREVPGIGLELVTTLDGHLRWAQLYRGGIGLEAAALEKREALEQRGWVSE